MNRERRSKQFADGNRAGEGAEHSDVLAGTKEVGHGEVLDVPELGDPGKGVDEGAQYRRMYRSRGGFVSIRDYRS